MNKTSIIIIAMAAILAFTALAVAATIFTQTVSWTVQDVSGEVLGQPASLNLGIVSVGNVTTLTYLVNNTGNVPLNITASHSFTGATVAWDKSTATIPVSGSTTFTATITITGAGSGAISFTS